MSIDPNYTSLLKHRSPGFPVLRDRRATWTDRRNSGDRRHFLLLLEKLLQLHQSAQGLEQIDQVEALSNHGALSSETFLWFIYSTIFDEPICYSLNLFLFTEKSREKRTCKFRYLDKPSLKTGHYTSITQKISWCAYKGNLTLLKQNAFSLR